MELPVGSAFSLKIDLVIRLIFIAVKNVRVDCIIQVWNLFSDAAVSHTQTVCVNIKKIKIEMQKN